jgi:hypothetical protein
MSPRTPRISENITSRRIRRLSASCRGLKASRYAFDVKPLGSGKPPYFCVFEAEFENEAAMMGAFASKEGQAVTGDVPNYASGGATMMHFAVK